jgi:RNA polymerase sigma factor (sigma-70 family)
LAEQTEPDWGRIVAEHGPAVWATVLRILKHRADAEDCYQQTFLDAVRSARRREAKNWAALLVSIATRRSIDRLRERIAGRNRGGDASAPVCVSASGASTSSGSAGVHVRELELRDTLRAGLARLPKMQAVAFWLRGVEELSYTEIAAELGIDANEVGVLIHRARASLKRHFAGEQPTARKSP